MKLQASLLLRHFMNIKLGRFFPWCNPVQTTMVVDGE